MRRGGLFSQKPCLCGCGSAVIYAAVENIKGQKMFLRAMRASPVQEF